MFLCYLVATCTYFNSLCTSHKQKPSGSYEKKVKNQSKRNRLLQVNNFLHHILTSDLTEIVMTNCSLEENYIIISGRKESLVVLLSTRIN